MSKKKSIKELNDISIMTFFLHPSSFSVTFYYGGQGKEFLNGVVVFFFRRRGIKNLNFEGCARLRAVNSLGKLKKCRANPRKLPKMISSRNFRQFIFYILIREMSLGISDVMDAFCHVLSFCSTLRVIQETTSTHDGILNRPLKKTGIFFSFTFNFRIFFLKKKRRY